MLFVSIGVGGELLKGSSTRFPDCEEKKDENPLAFVGDSLPERPVAAVGGGCGAVGGNDVKLERDSLRTAGLSNLSTSQLPQTVAQ